MMAGRSGAGTGAAGAAQKEHTRLSMYAVPPSDDVPLEVFDQMAHDRLKVLKMLEASSAGHLDLVPVQKLDKETFWSDARSARGQRDWDTASHFILRLAYCKTDELQRWFIGQELALFKMRFVVDPNPGEFMRDSGLTFEQVNVDDVGPELRADLDSVAQSQMQNDEWKAGKALPRQYYTVPFEDVTGLVAHRRVLLRGGYAFVPPTELLAIVASRFRAQLSRAMKEQGRALPELELGPVDERLKPLLAAYSEQSLENTYRPKSGDAIQVVPADIDRLSEKHFPLCMRYIHQRLRGDHHLKHFCRLQYGLYLKGIGLKMEDLHALYRQEFVKKGLTSEQFEKQYGYNIRHMYGKEGKRQDYTPFACSQIIKNSPGAGEHHGCPFRHHDKESLVKELMACGLASDALRQVMDLVNGSHYQSACAMMFSQTHGIAHDLAITHPNQYFSDSIKHYKLKLEVPALPEGGAGSAAAAAAGGAADAKKSAPSGGAAGNAAATAAAAGRSASPARGAAGAAAAVKAE